MSNKEIIDYEFLEEDEPLDANKNHKKGKTKAGNNQNQDSSREKTQEMEEGPPQDPSSRSKGKGSFILKEIPMMRVMMMKTMERSSPFT